MAVGSRCVVVLLLFATLLTHAEAQWPAARGCATNAGIYEGGVPTNLTMDWMVDTPGPIAADLAFVGPLVVAPISLDHGTFLHVWNRETSEPVHGFNETRIQGNAVATTSRIVASTPDHAWVRWNHDGSDFRRFVLPARAIGSPVLFGDDAFFRLADDTIVKIATDSGEVEWTFPAGAAALHVTSQRVIFTTKDQLVALRHDGEVDWAHTVDGTGGLGAIWEFAVGNGSVFFTVNAWSLHALSLATGEFQWSSPEIVQGARWATLVYAGGRVLLHDPNDVLTAFDATSGVEIWSTSPEEHHSEAASGGGAPAPHNVPVAADQHRLGMSRHAGSLEIRNLASGALLESHDFAQPSSRQMGPVAQGNQIAVPLRNAIAIFSGEPNQGRDCDTLLGDPGRTNTPTDTWSESPAQDSSHPAVASICAIALALAMRCPKRGARR